MTNTTISIATDFSRHPIGRYRRLGPNSGERCRDDLIAPALRSDPEVVLTINLDGVATAYSSSFLEETFGGLVRVQGFSKAELARRLKFVTTKWDRDVLLIWKYIADAVPHSKAS
jgi:hypothetical protein